MDFLYEVAHADIEAEPMPGGGPEHGGGMPGGGEAGPGMGGGNPGGGEAGPGMGGGNPGGGAVGTGVFIPGGLTYIPGSGGTSYPEFPPSWVPNDRLDEWEEYRKKGYGNEAIRREMKLPPYDQEFPFPFPDFPR